jgi:hypothetical protein
MAVASGLAAGGPARPALDWAALLKDAVVAALAARLAADGLADL